MGENKTEKTNYEIMDAIREYFDDKNVEYSMNNEEGSFLYWMPVMGKMKMLECFIDVKDTFYNVYAFAPIRSPQNDSRIMGKVAEFICKTNNEIHNGNFGLDYEDGEILFKSYVNFAGGFLPTKEIIRDSILSPIALFGRYGDGFIDIILGGISVDDSIKRCEEYSTSHRDELVEWIRKMG